MKITTNLWFDTQAEDAARFYCALFPNSKITTVARYSAEVAKAAHMQEGQVMTVAFDLDGHSFLGLNGGPIFKFSEAVSFVVPCADQAEIDRYWDALTADGGQPGQCGWLKDRFGLSWQIVPASLERYMTTGSAEQQRRVMAAVMQMQKLDADAIERAFEAP